MPPLLSQTKSGILRNFYLFQATSGLIQNRNESIKTRFSALYALIELIVGFNKIRHLHALTKTVMHDVIKSAVVYLTAKLAMRKIAVALSPGNALNMTLASLKWSSHLLQFMSSQDILLLLENLAQFAKILFTISMPT